MARKQPQDRVAAGLPVLLTLRTLRTEPLTMVSFPQSHRQRHVMLRSALRPTGSRAVSFPNRFPVMSTLPAGTLVPVLQCFLDASFGNHCPNGVIAPCEFSSGHLDIMAALKEYAGEGTRQGARCSAETNGQAWEGGTAKAETDTTQAKPAPDGALRP